MVLVADSGSTKTDWRLINEKREIKKFQTIGFNPFFIDSKGIAKELNKSLPSYVLPDDIGYVYFYGAGCSSQDRCNIVRRGLEKIFCNAKIEVEHDILGVARILFGAKQGIAVILGTGSNTCYYNGTKIVKNITALGYILGDEGSGAYLGTKLIKAFLNYELPEKLHKSFVNEYKLTEEDILNAVYRKPLPNRFLASFTRFLSKNLEHPYISKLVYEGFEDFFVKHISIYENYKSLKIRCAGSIAYHFQSILTRVARYKNASIDKIIEYPIDELVKYHAV